jgi:NSS family neurotransmitter:Na+ symporter
MTQTEILEVMQTSGPAGTGLTFIWMPQLFAQMPFGSTLAVLFFLGLAFAALSSLISMIELATRVFVDAGLARRTAVASVCSVGFLMGVPSAMNLNIFANQDFVWGVGLLISGAFVAFAVIRYGVQQFRREAIGAGPGDVDPGRGWDVLAGLVVPIQAVVLLAWWLYQSAAVYAPDSWFNPLEPFSVMTCLVQWGAVLITLLALNRWMVRRTLGTPSPMKGS